MIFPQRRWVVFVWFRFLSVAAPLRDVGFGGGVIVPQRRWEQGPSRNDAEDTSRSLGFSPGTNFSSFLKLPVFFRGWGRAGMLGLPCVLGVRNDAGDKSRLGRQIDFSSSKNIVFFEGWAGQECPGYLFVLGVWNARATGWS